MRIAVVDLGTNSTRLLVADVVDGRVAELDRRTNVTRLGEGVDASGRLADAAVERVLDAVAGYRRAIDDLGAERIVAVATSAVRDAENGEAFRSTLCERFGIDARTISGDEEARLTFLGATSTPAGDEPGATGEPGATNEPGAAGEPGTANEPGAAAETLVLDIGGGSTEYVVGVPGEAPRFHVSTRAGSVRQTERHLATDPPLPEQLDALGAEVRAIVGRDVPATLREETASGIAVAGTATSLAAIDLRLDPYDSELVHGHRLALPACERMLAMLAALPLDERREVTGLHPDRAPTILAGAVILVESMRAFGLDSVRTSEADILHGAALAAAGGAAGLPQSSAS